MIQKILSPLSILLTISFSTAQPLSKTEIMKWQFGKKAAVSLTYDDGSINQFTQALPIMNRLNIPATFYIITGQIPGATYQGKFIGRPVEQIINETATAPTNATNLFERASAIGFLGLQGTLEYHTKAGAAVDAEKPEDAYTIIDGAYQKVREGAFKPKSNQDNRKGITWDEIREYARQGHEFGSHTVTHPYLAALDEVNMLYELEKSKAEILNQLGERYTFSAECPYGTENERVMEYAYKIYPALRNRMPEPWLEEINRPSKMLPGTSKKEIVQWQRGATTKTPLPLMKSWVDTVASHSNNWLVLVFHGVDGIGYEALPHEMLDEYFQYMKQREADLWIATFADVTKYMRERKSATVVVKESKEKIVVTLTHSLEKKWYDVPLTLKTFIPNQWKSVQVKQGAKTEKLISSSDSRGTFVLYQAMPNAGPVELSVSSK